MKKTIKLFGIIAIAAVIGFGMTACSDDGGGKPNEVSVSAADFDSTIKELRTVTGEHIITLTTDLIDYPGISLSTAGANITVKGNTASRKITWKHSATSGDECPLFYVKAGKLTLENITISRGVGNTKDWPLLNALSGGTVEMGNGATLSYSESDKHTYGGVWLGDDGAFIMSGGTIENCKNGVETDKKNVEITISGGTIRNNNNGIGMWSTSEDCILTITGGKISGNENRGVAVEGKNNKVIMSGGEIRENGWNDGTNYKGGGIGLGVGNGEVTISGDAKIKENKNHGVQANVFGDGVKINMDGGEISGNTRDGVQLQGQKTLFTMTDGKIADNKRRGVNCSYSTAVGSRIIMSGGTIGGNANWGLLLGCADVGFEKQIGAVIYGKNAGADSNTEGAIRLRKDDLDTPSGDELKRLEGDAGSDKLYAAILDKGSKIGTVSEDNGVAMVDFDVYSVPGIKTGSLQGTGWI